MAGHSSGARSPLPLRTRTLVTQRYRYSRYSTGALEIYDLEADPDERTNLAARDSASGLRAALSEQMLEAALALSPMTTLG
jgi:hypothetical protein